MPLENYTIHFSSEDGNISIQEFATYLTYLRSVYSAAYLYMLDQGIDGQSISKINIGSMLTPVRNSIPKEEFWSFFDIDLEKNELVISEMDKHSPAVIKGHAVVLALTIAIIFSGGEAKLSKEGMEFKVPPIGQGIKEFRKGLWGEIEKSDEYSLETHVSVEEPIEEKEEEYQEPENPAPAPGSGLS